MRGNAERDVAGEIRREQVDFLAAARANLPNGAAIAVSSSGENRNKAKTKAMQVKQAARR